MIVTSTHYCSVRCEGLVQLGTGRYHCRVQRCDLLQAPREPNWMGGGEVKPVRHPGCILSQYPRESWTLLVRELCSDERWRGNSCEFCREGRNIVVGEPYLREHDCVVLKLLCCTCGRQVGQDLCRDPGVVAAVKGRLGKQVGDEWEFLPAPREAKNSKAVESSTVAPLWLDLSEEPEA